MRCSNTVFIFTQETWCKIEVKRTSTIHFFCQILLSNIPVIENKISISHKVKKVNKKKLYHHISFLFHLIRANICAQLSVNNDLIYWTISTMRVKWGEHYYKRYFIIDQQIARHFVHHSECLYVLLKIINSFLASWILANHTKGLDFSQS